MLKQKLYLPSLWKVRAYIEFGKYLTKITDRIYLMQFPDDNIINAISQHLNQTFGFNFLICNISEYKYNAELFNNQVIDFVFPGYPNPPLETFFVILKELDSWLSIDAKHIAIIHCQPSMVQ